VARSREPIELGLRWQWYASKLPDASCCGSDERVAGQEPWTQMEARVQFRSRWVKCHSPGWRWTTGS